MTLRELKKGEALSLENLSDYSRREVERLSPEGQQALLAKTSRIWVFEAAHGTEFAFGIYRPMLLGPRPMGWFLLYKTPRHSLRAMKSLSRILHSRYPSIEVHVERNWHQGAKFAKAMGFHFADVQTYEGREFDHFIGVK